MKHFTSNIIFFFLLAFSFSAQAEENPALTCYDGLNISLGVNNESVQLWPTDILAGNSGPNNEYTLVLIDMNGDTVANNLVTVAYLGQTLIAYVTEISSGDSCWGSVHVGGCNQPFVICDTECRTAPIGDCDSGHSLTDGVEWPCDLTLTVCELDDLSPSDLLENPDVHEMDAQPTIYDPCDVALIGTTYQDNVFILNDSTTKIIRNWTVIDWMTGLTGEYAQVIIASLNDCNGECIDDVTPPVAICDGFLVVSLGSDGTAYVTPEMVDDGSYDNCRIDTMILNSYEFTCADIGPNNQLMLTIYDEAGNSNSCWIDVTVEGNNGTNLTCLDALTIALDADEEVTFYPSDFTLGSGSNCSSTNLEILDENNIVVPDNTIDASYWGDTLFAFVSDVTTGTACWSNLYVLADTCTVLFTICDFKCNSEPLGDCDSGHTDQDDVEWPCDLNISACHSDQLDPNYLVNNLGIDPINAEPQLFNTECGIIATTYEDEVFILADSTFKIYRLWTVVDWTQANGNIPFTLWSYTQTIYVSTIGCSNATYCVNTLNGRNLPGVLIDNVEITDDYGCTAADEANPSPILSKADDIQNGLDIFDYLMIREHILGITVLSSDQQIAADFNRNGHTTTLDLVYLYKAILGEDVAVDSAHWQFFDDGGDALNNGHSFKAIKRGDVNDDAITGAPDNINAPIVSMEVKDIILNLGESYMVPIMAKDFQSIQGGHFQFAFNSDIIEITAIESPIHGNFSDEDYNITEDHVFINWVVSDEEFESGKSLNPNEELIFIHFKALQNQIASNAFTFNSVDKSKMAKPYDKSRYFISYNWDKTITKNHYIHNEELNVNISPNPANAFITISLNQVNNEPMQLQIRNLHGQVVYEQAFNNEAKILTNTFRDGLHFLTISNDNGHFYSDKFIINH